jgi:GAF domain-containing protein
MNKTDLYQELYSQINAIIHDEPDFIANMANISALLFERMSEVNWVGFYRVKSNELVLGPFQGQVACIRIPLGKGVCGTAVSSNTTQRVVDVHAFEGHIACDASTNSEIVIPVRVNNDIIAVLDIDSASHSRFDQDDQQGLETIVTLLENNMIKNSMVER